jgi:outer membrane protein assembly factor BamB
MKFLAAGLLVVLGILMQATTAWTQVSYAPGDWPQWRGPNADGISLDKGLLKDWPTDGPPVLWHVDSVGVGYSSLAIKDGKIFTQGDLDGVEHVIALNAKDGRTLWKVQPGPTAETLEKNVAATMKQLDKNGDGQVSEIEGLARFGWDLNKSDTPTSDSVDVVAERRSSTLFKALDKDADGQLSFAEVGNLFRDVMEKIDQPDAKADPARLAAERATAFMKSLDKDGDGQISRKEARGTALDRGFARLDVRDPGTNKGDEQLTLAEIEAGLLKQEPGRDGLLTLPELKAYYVQQSLTGDGVLTALELHSALGGFRNNMGDGPRGTPTVDGDRLYVEGGNGDVACLEAATGKTIWYVNLRNDFGGGLPGWGYSESPLVVEDLLIVTPGGKEGTMVALKKSGGELVWRSKEVTEGAHYSTPVLATIDGVRQVVQFANQSVFGVSLADGRSLWRYAAPANGTANCCSPIVSDDSVFASSAYGTGGGLAKIVTTGSVQQAEEVYFSKKLACHHGGMIKLGNYIYSAGGGTLLCMEFSTGKIMWQARSAGKGALCLADGMLYLLGEQHEVALAEATPDGYHEHGRFKIESHGRPAWAHPVVTGGRFYIRDQQSLTAYDVRAR